MHLIQRIMITSDSHPETYSEIPVANSGLRALLAAEIQKTNTLQASPLGRALHYWNGNPKMRIAVGLGLLAGGVVATATGALGAAGIIMGARAGISALGAFTTSKGIYDVVRGRQPQGEIERLVTQAKNARNMEELEPAIQRIESRYDQGELHGLIVGNLRKERSHRMASNIIAGTAATVAGLLSLGGGISEAHAASLAPNPEIAHTVSSASMVASLDVSAIADDVRHDHPGQGWVTLEQMVRRVEWLRQGIGLDQSEKLAVLNASVSNTVHDPNGIVAAALAQRGYDMSHGVEYVSRRLGEDEIRNIVQEYAERTAVASGVVAAVDTPPITHVAVPTPNFPIQADTPPPALGNDRAFTGTSLLVGGAVIAASLWYRGRRKAGGAETGTLPIEPFATASPTPIAPSPIPPTTTPESFALPELGNGIRQKTREYFHDAYGWSHDPESTVSDSEKTVDAFQGSTFCGSYRIYVEYREQEMRATILWYDHDAARMHVQTDAVSYASLHSENYPNSLVSLMDGLYERMLLRREELKSEDMKNIHAIRIPRGHLRKMYSHMEQGPVRRNNNEVLGYWISSAYSIRSGVLDYLQMANPKLSEQTITRATCAPKHAGITTKYHYDLPNEMIRVLLPAKESEMILGIRHRKLNDPKIRGVVFTGAACAYNWHKHPDGITRPSGGDASEAIKDIDIQYPGRETHPYTIAVRIRESEIPALTNDPKVLVLSKSEYGWEHSYAIRSYNMIYVNREYLGMPQMDILVE